MPAIKKIRYVGLKLLLIMVLLALLCYGYLVRHAESLFSDFVRYETKGSIGLEIKKLRFNFKALRLTLIEARLFSVDTSKNASSYNVQTDTIVLELAALRPLFFGKQLKVDTILIKKPHINVVKRKKLGNDTFNLPQQMDLAYRSLNKALNQFSVKYCLIDSGRFKLTDLTIPNSKPLLITDYYLMIDHLQKDKSNDQRFLFADKVKFYSSKQQITSLDGKHQLHYSRLRINSYRRLIELDSCYIFSQPSPGNFNKFGGFFDTLRFTNVDFVHLVEHNTLLADSVYCINPKVDISTLIKEKENRSGKMKMLKNKDSLVAAVKSLMGNFQLKYIGVDNGSVNLVTKKGEKTSRYSLQKSDFALQDVVVIDHPEIPLQIGRFDLGLMGYQAIDPDSSYVVKFDSVRLLNDHVYLSNFSIQPYLNFKQGSVIKHLKTKALVVNDVQWDELLTSRKVVATSVELIQPDLELDSDNNKEQPKNKKNIFRLFHAIAPFSSIHTLYVRDANISIENNGSQYISFQGLFTELKVNGFLQSGSFEDLGKAIKDLSFHQADMQLHSGHLSLRDGYVRGGDKMLWIKKLNLENDEGSLLFSFEDLSVNDLESFSKGKIIAGGLHWEKANLTANTFKKKGKADPEAAPLEISLQQIKGSNTLLNINNSQLNVYSSLSIVEANDFFWNTSQSPHFSDASMVGDFFRYKKNDFRLSTEDFQLNSKAPSFLKVVKLSMPANNGLLELNATNIKFTPILNDFHPVPLQINNCELNAPVITWKKTKTAPRNIVPNKIKFPALSIHQFSLVQPSIQLADNELSNSILIDDWNMELKIKQLHSSPDSGIYCNGINLFAKNFGYQSGNKKFAISDTGNLNINLSSLTLNTDPLKEKPVLNAYIQSIAVAGLNMRDSDSVGVSKLFQLHTLKLKNLNLKDLLYVSKENILADNHFQLDNATFSVSNPNTFLHLSNLHTENEKWMAFDTLVFHPSDSLSIYLKKYDYQKDYLSFYAGVTRMGGLNKSLLLKEGQLVIDSLMMLNARLEIFKDKRLPFLKGINKQLPVGLLQKIPILFQVNKFNLSNAHVDYQELNDKNNKIGKVDFSGMQIAVSDLKNIEMHAGDSLNLQGTGYFMGKAPIRFRYAQSYTDTFGGFSLGIRFRPFDLRQFNKALEPLVGASVVSGNLDTIRLNAIGSDSIAHGKMKMYYRGLKIRYSGVGLDSVRNLKSRLITFLANDFVLKRNNSKGYGIVYTSRDKERSFANYWMRIGLSGVMSSSGFKSNKKQEKQYKKMIEKMKIPELPEIGL